jgi:addiction module RelE/StbE family toxin
VVQIRWSKQAIENIFQIREYYLELSTHFADELTNQIFSKEEIISAFPEIGRVVPELNNKSVRELIYKNYRIIYVIFDKENICIIAVHHSSKPLSQLSLFE